MVRIRVPISQFSVEITLNYKEGEIERMKEVVKERKERRKYRGSEKDWTTNIYIYKNGKIERMTKR